MIMYIDRELGKGENPEKGEKTEKYEKAGGRGEGAELGKLVARQGLEKLQKSLSLIKNNLEVVDTHLPHSKPNK